jgi:dephospho-CoA kinase
MLIIGLTGGIGSGKSTVADYFKALGVPIIDTDAIARELVEPGHPALQEIVSHFGPAIVDDEGALRRDQLRHEVFADPHARKRLESILHPRIRHEVKQHIARLLTPYCLVVIPLLVEKGWQNEVDRVLVVDTPEETQLRRTMIRDGISQKEAENIMHTQVSRQERLQAAHDVLHNDSDLDALKDQMDKLHKKYIQLAGY